jgi:hypothetical protein
MNKLKQMAGTALALTFVSFNGFAQPSKPQATVHNVELRLADDLDAPPGLGHAALGDMESNMKRMFISPADGPEQPLIISTGSLDQDDVGNLEEDMTIMARILEKSVNRAGAGGDDSTDRKAMGIHLWALGQALNRGARDIYVEGTGAIFILGANMPLVGQPKVATDEKEKKETNSAWESARTEIFGENESELKKARRERVTVAPYDAGRIDALKKNLIDSLKNAANIRGLKDNETITIVVQGPAGRGYAVANGNVRVQHIPGNVEAFTFNNAEPRRTPKTLLTLRAKKGDINEFATGKIDAEQFRKKVSVSTYQSGGDAARVKN